MFSRYQPRIARFKRSRFPLSYVQAALVSSPYLRGRDMNNRLPRTNNTLQNGNVVVDDDWSKGASSCGKGDSFTVSSQKLGDLSGCYIKTAQHNGEATYTLDDRVGRKYMVATTRVHESDVSPDVHWTLGRMDSLHNDIFCISVDLAYHTHPVDASWTCDFSQSGTFAIASNPNDLIFSCDCPTVTRDSRYKTAHHRRTTFSNDTDFPKLAVLVVVFCMLVVRCWLLFRRARAQQPRIVVERRVVCVGDPTRRARGVHYSSSAETARNTSASTTTSSNEPGSHIEMMHPLRPLGAAEDNPGDSSVEGDKLLEIEQ